MPNFFFQILNFNAKIVPDIYKNNKNFNMLEIFKRCLSTQDSLHQNRCSKTKIEKKPFKLFQLLSEIVPICL